MNRAALSGLAGCCFALVAGPVYGETQPYVKWDPASLRLLERGGTYGRMASGPDSGTYVFVCERRQGVWMRESGDAGATWTDARLIASRPAYNLANPELLLLKDGAWLCFFNLRPHAGNDAPFAIAVSRRERASHVWSPLRVLFEAGHESRNGCWEPAAAQLPSGEIHLYFANEAPYRDSNEQEIALMRSTDGGLTWDKVERVGFRERHRDGMPVPLVLNSGNGVAVAIEDNGIDGHFKPAILYTRLPQPWRSGTVTAAHRDRWPALAAPLPASTYAGAPYLRQWTSGETALSFQMSADGEIKHSRIAVCVGDAHARRFSGLTLPFPETPAHAQLWASLCVTSRDTIAVLATATFSGTNGVWCMGGRLQSDTR